MSSSYKVNKNLSATIGTTTGYPIVNGPQVSLPPRIVSARASADAAPADTVAGLDDGAQISVGLLAANWTALMALNGTETTVKIMEGTATTVFDATCLLSAELTSDPGSMAVVNLVGKLQALPTTPSLSHLAYS